MAQAGTYGGTQGVPDPTDMGTADPNLAGTQPAFSNFDELSQFGVSPSLSAIPVPWSMKTIQQGDISALSPYGQEMVGRDVPDQTVSYDQAIRSIYSPDMVGAPLQRLQDMMAAGGFYGNTPNYIPGSPDLKYTGPVWSNVVKQAMREKKTPTQIIQEAVDANGGLEAGLAKHQKTGPVAPSVGLTHPDDIRMMAKEISVKTLGKGWNNDQIENFVKTYQSMQSAAGNTGGTHTEAPSLQGAVQAEARRQNPVAAAATDADTAMQMMMNSFKTLGGGL